MKRLKSLIKYILKDDRRLFITFMMYFLVTYTILLFFLVKVTVKCVQ